MTQLYKSVYFRDIQRSTKKSSITVAFGERDRDVFDKISLLSSDTLRKILGYESFSALHRDAVESDRSVNSFVLRLLREYSRGNGSYQSRTASENRFTQHISIDALQATYRGGHQEPMHAWYPLLEGYSPAFVETVLQRYAPKAKTVCDPFAGAGTTPITVAKLGRQALYCEVNPVLQLVIATKAEIVQMRESARDLLVEKLLQFMHSFRRRMQYAKPDEQLVGSYSACFGRSTFFDRLTFDSVVKCRKVIDEVSGVDPQVARILTIAVLRSLIPTSLLIRRGDVRFMTPQELSKRGPVDLVAKVNEGIAKFVHDLGNIGDIVEHAPTLILENAKNLENLPKLNFDFVVTSPPYLNGTNYFRNTKIELWFLRRLRSQRDLSNLRLESLTAGINDVTVAKSVGALPKCAVPVIDELQKEAYDARIPRMVACFASEMHSIMRAIARRMSTKGVIAIDIGDSAYAGVRVPTEEFISESLESAGFELFEQHVLRERRSRNQMQLTQRLLVFARNERTKFRREDNNRNKEMWRPGWESFKKHLPHQEGEFKKRNWGHPLHSLCSYQGKMKPSLAAHLVRTFVQPGEKLLDPFSGVGTIAFESALHGIESWAFDISPPAVYITAGKIESSNRASCKALVDRLEDFISSDVPTKSEFESAGAIRFNGPLVSYFHERTLKEILLARRFFQQNVPSNGSESLVLAALLHILHGNRPYALSRRSHPITPFAPSGPAEYRALIPRLLNKIERSFDSALPDRFVEGHAVKQDVTEWWPSDVQNLDAVVTSPPFFASTRFHASNWLRLWFTGWEVEDFRARPSEFLDERQKHGFEVYEAVFRQCRERLKRGGVVVLHLGRNQKCDMAEELSRIGRRWFTVSDTFVESVAHCEKHGISDKGRTADHQYLILH